MAILYDSAAVLNLIRNVGGLNNVQVQGTDDLALLAYMNDILRSKIVPHLIKLREEYLVHSTRIAVGNTITRYRLPERAVGNRLRDLVFVDASDNRTIISSRHIPRDELPLYPNSGSHPVGWTMEGNYIQLVPTVGTYSGFLEMGFYMRPSALVAQTAAGKISAINLASKQVTITGSTLPATFVNGAKMDIHSFKSGAELKVYDVTISGAPAAQVITFAEVIDGSVFGTMAPEVGDWVCLANESALLQIPDDLIPAVTQGVALRVMVGDRDETKARLIAAILKDQLAESEGIFRDRVESKTPRIRGVGAIAGWDRGW